MMKLWRCPKVMEALQDVNSPILKQNKTPKSFNALGNY